MIFIFYVCFDYFRTADKESLTQELNKLQQSHRQLKSDLGARMDQLKQADLQRQTMESQMHQLNLDVSKRVKLAALHVQCAIH